MSLKHTNRTISSLEEFAAMLFHSSLYYVVHNTEKLTYGGIFKANNQKLVAKLEEYKKIKNTLDKLGDEIETEVLGAL